MKKPFKIIFMGTPDFALPALRALHKNGQDVVLVVTQPDRPKGRGRKIFPTPVKEMATRLGYEVIQPDSIQTSAFETVVTKNQPDIIVVVAFGRIIPKNILALPKLGTINIHASLLPKYRGPAPIQWAIINGESETGITLILMDEGLDTGDILLSSAVAIDSDDTSGTLHDRLADLGADLLLQVLKLFETNGITSTPQDHSRATYAPLLKKKDGRMDWKMPAQSLEAFIRGMSPWPGAFTYYGDKRLKIFKAAPLEVDTTELPGTVIKGFPGELRVAAGKGALSIVEIQGESGRRLPVEDFLKGQHLPEGTRLT